MKKIHKVIGMVGTFLLTLSSVWADDVALAQEKLNHISQMKATFKEVVRSSKNKVLSKSSGTMAMWRPGRFRWVTSTPMEQWIIADGKKLWIYDVDLEQVTVKSQSKGVGGTPALFLSNNNKQLAEDFSVEKKEDGSILHFILTSKRKNNQMKRVDLFFDGDELKKIDFYDALSQYTSIQLSKIDITPTLNPKLFIFSPPKGVDVVDQK